MSGYILAEVLLNGNPRLGTAFHLECMAAIECIDVLCIDLCECIKVCEKYKVTYETSSE